MENFWYDLNHTLSYNALFNFVIGGRGVGKTFAFWKRAINSFLKTGAQFIYLRRYQSELDLVKETSFTPVLLSGEVPEGTEMKCWGDIYFINGEQAGYAMALSKAADYKSSAYPLVNLIGYDEFLTEKKPGYLKNETDKFFDFYETVARMRDDVIVIFISNAITMANPYFVQWDLSVPKGKNISVKNDMLLELVDSQNYADKKRKTRLGKIISNYDYSKYSIDNEFLLDSDSFVQPLQAPVDYKGTIIWEGKSYGVYINYRIGIVYIHDSFDKSYPLKYCFSDEDHKENTLLIKNIKRVPPMYEAINAFSLGCLRFTSQKVRNEIYPLIKKVF